MEIISDEVHREWNLIPDKPGREKREESHSTGLAEPHTGNH